MRAPSQRSTTSASSRTSARGSRSRGTPRGAPAALLPCVPSQRRRTRAAPSTTRRDGTRPTPEVADRPLVQPIVLQVGPALRRRHGPGRRRVDAAGRAPYGLLGEPVRLRHARVVEHRGERVELVERLARLDRVTRRRRRAAGSAAARPARGIRAPNTASAGAAAPRASWSRPWPTGPRSVAFGSCCSCPAGVLALAAAWSSRLSTGAVCGASGAAAVSAGGVGGGGSGEAAARLVARR